MIKLKNLLKESRRILTEGSSIIDGVEFTDSVFAADNSWLIKNKLKVARGIRQLFKDSAIFSPDNPNPVNISISVPERKNEGVVKEASPDSVPIVFRGTTYYVNKENLEDNTMSKLFLFLDPKLDKVFRGSKGVMLVRKSDIESKLK